MEDLFFYVKMFFYFYSIKLKPEKMNNTVTTQPTDIKESKVYLMISQDLRSIKAYEGKWPKVIGDKIDLEGKKYSIFQLHLNFTYAKACLNMFDFRTHVILAKSNLKIN